MKTAQCPDCGRVFTLEELGLTPGDLLQAKRKVKTGGRMGGRPAGAKDKKPRKGRTTK